MQFTPVSALVGGLTLGIAAVAKVCCCVCLAAVVVIGWLCRCWVRLRVSWLCVHSLDSYGLLFPLLTYTNTQKRSLP